MEKDNDKKKIYLTGSYFTQGQQRLYNLCRNKLVKQGFEVYNPIENRQKYIELNEFDETFEGAIWDGKFLSREEIIDRITYKENCWQLMNCDALVAVSPNNNINTFWEAGFIVGFNAGMHDMNTWKPIKVIYLLEGETTVKNLFTEYTDYIFTDYDGVNDLISVL